MNSGTRFETPIVSIHDKGAGSNVLKESIPNGAVMTIHNLVVGDPTIWVKELWVFCRRMLIREKDLVVVEEVGHRGVVGDGQDHGHGPHGCEWQQGSGVERDAEYLCGPLRAYGATAAGPAEGSNGDAARCTCR